MSAICKPQAQCVEGKVQITWYKSTPRFKTDKASGVADRAWPVRVWRREEVEFVRGEDREEYFLTRGCDGATLIYNGPLTPSNKRKFTLVDEQANWRTTYSYFIQAEDDARPIGPVPVRGTDPEVYWSYRRLWAELTALQASEPARTTLITCGYTGAGRAIPALRVGRQGPRLVLIGLIHPGESGPELIVPALRALLEQDSALFDHVQVLALPAVNLDGREMQVRGVPWYLRRTPGGIDLNRNFPADWSEPALNYGLDSRDPDSETYRGEIGGGAAETQAVIGALRAAPPNVLLSYHALSSICALPAIYALAAQNDAEYERRCRATIEAFGSGLRGKQNFEARWIKPAAEPGSLPLWTYRQFSAPAFDLELDQEHDDLPSAQCDEVDRPMLQRYQQHHRNGLRSLLKFLSHSSVDASAYR
ncbi:MAG: M14 family zinc carboxypeptidase [bacterium]